MLPDEYALTPSVLERDITQEGNHVICTPWVPIHLSFTRSAGAAPLCLSVYEIAVYFTPTGPTYFVFCRLYPFFPQPSRHCIAGSALRWERFRGTQKEDDRGSLVFNPLWRMWENVTTKGRMHLPCKHWHNGGTKNSKTAFSTVRTMCSHCTPQRMYNIKKTIQKSMRLKSSFVKDWAVKICDCLSCQAHRLRRERQLTCDSHNSWSALYLHASVLGMCVSLFRSSARQSKICCTVQFVHTISSIRTTMYSLECIPRLTFPEAEFMNVQFFIDVSGQNLENSQIWGFCMDFLNHREGGMVFLLSPLQKL